MKLDDWIRIDSMLAPHVRCPAERVKLVCAIEEILDWNVCGGFDEGVRFAHQTLTRSQAAKRLSSVPTVRRSAVTP